MKKAMFKCSLPCSKHHKKTFFLWFVEQKLPSRTVDHAFLESRQTEVTINPCYVLSTEGSQKEVSAHGLCISDYAKMKNTRAT